MKETEPEIALPPGYGHDHYAEVTSTMDVAAAAYKAGKGHGHIITADAQTAGRGSFRGGARRSWSTMPGNLTMTMLVDTKARQDYAAELSLLVAAAMGEALHDVLPPEKNITYKWPNDILIDDHFKVCGILIEGAHNDPMKLVGVGVNILTHPDPEALRQDASYQATCLQACGAAVEVTADHLLVRFIQKWDPLYTLWQEQGLAPILLRMGLAYEEEGRICVKIMRKDGDEIVTSGAFEGICQGEIRVGTQRFNADQYQLGRLR